MIQEQWHWAQRWMTRSREKSWAGGRDSKREGNLRRSKRKQQLSYQHKRDFEGHQQLGGRILSLAWLKISESTEIHQREQDESQHMLGCGGRMLTVKLPTRKKWKVIKIQKNNTPWDSELQIFIRTPETYIAWTWHFILVCQTAISPLLQKQKSCCANTLLAQQKTVELQVYVKKTKWSHVSCWEL